MDRRGPVREPLLRDAARRRDAQTGEIELSAPFDVLIRADASLRIGTGHVFRTLNLAADLRERGHTVAYAVRPLAGNLIDRIRAYGFEAIELDDRGAAQTGDWLEVEQGVEVDAMMRLLDAAPRPPRWVIVDHYELDARWESSVRAATGARILAFDDLANRPHVVHALLDGTLAPADRYEGLVPANCVQLLGPRHQLFRASFLEARTRTEPRDEATCRVLIFYGGVDWSGETIKALDALRSLPEPFEIDVVLGTTNPRRAEVLERIARDPRARLQAGDAEMAELTARADLAFGGGGNAMWERCFVGCPSIVTSMAEFQRLGVRRVGEVGACIAIEEFADVDADDLAEYARALLADGEARLDMSRKASALFDGHVEARARLLELFD